MSELTYKKIVDVEQVETLNDAATVFINDDGTMKQVAADKLVAVKTVNGVEPDENGDLTVVEPQTFVFTNIDGDVDCPYEVSELIKFATNASAYKSVRFVHRVRDLFDLSVPIRDYVWTGASIPATGTGVFQINFGDEIAPILINSNANTITLDPDWVAPTACVKTVNGVAPDENGEVYIGEQVAYLFADGTALVPDLFTWYGPGTLADAVDRLGKTNKEITEIHRLTMTPNGAGCMYKSIGHEKIKNADSSYNARILFGDNVRPVIFDTINNKIIADPDWIAPEANITESAANTLVDTKVAELSTTVDTKLSELAAQELSLPKSAGVVDHGTAGQFAVSDGMGGIMWKTLVEAEEVSY